MLYEKLCLGLPNEIKTRVEQGQIVVGEVGLKNPFAYIEKFSEDQSLIVMHSGIFEFLYRIARPLSATIFRVEGKSEEIGINTSDLARIICEIFWWQEKTNDNFGPGYLISNEQKYLANLLANSAESFLLAHEFGHAAIWLGADVGVLQSPLSPEDEETAADALGLHMFISAQTADPNTPEGFLELSLAYAGAEFSLQVWDVMSRLNLGFVDGVHPPSRRRIDELRTTLRGFTETDEVHNALLQIAKQLDQIFGEVVRIIDSRGGEYADLYDQQENELVDAIRKSLFKCAEGPIPDYMTFYSEALDLMNQGYAHSVLQNVFNNVTADFKVSQLQSNEVDQGDALLRFKRFKLLLGLVTNMPEPAKSLYQLSLDRLTEN